MEFNVFANVIVVYEKCIRPPPHDCSGIHFTALFSKTCAYGLMKFSANF